MSASVKSLDEYLVEINREERRLRAAKSSKGVTTSQRGLLATQARTILEYYSDVRAERSFMDAAGQIYDAIPIESQASFKAQGDILPLPPNAPGWEQDEMMSGAPVRASGNVDSAPIGTVPILRRALNDVLRRRPRIAPPDIVGPEGGRFGSEGGPLRATVGSEYHYHSVSGKTSNGSLVGGHGQHALFRPLPDLQTDQVFSLSQQWHIAGTLRSQPFNAASSLQSVELGWTNESKGGLVAPIPFVASTNDGYNLNADGVLTGWTDGVGSGSPFVQTNNLWAVGSPLTPLGLVDGVQRVFSCGALLQDGKWWIYYGGRASTNALGYYPASWFKNGPISDGAEVCEWGGEVAGFTQSDGVRRFGGMGSGQHASTGWRKAAYIRNIVVYPNASTAALPTGLAPFSTHTGYSAQVANYASPWNRTLWYGGPGGTAT